MSVAQAATYQNGFTAPYQGFLRYGFWRSFAYYFYGFFYFFFWRTRLEQGTARR